MVEDLFYIKAHCKILTLNTCNQEYYDKKIKSSYNKTKNELGSALIKLVKIFTKSKLLMLILAWKPPLI